MLEKNQNSDRLYSLAQEVYDTSEEAMETVLEQETLPKRILAGMILVGVFVLAMLSSSKE